MTLLIIPDPRVAGGWEGWQIEALGQGVLSYEGSQAEKPTVCEPQSSTRVKSWKLICCPIENVVNCPLFLIQARQEVGRDAKSKLSESRCYLMKWTRLRNVPFLSHRA